MLEEFSRVWPWLEKAARRYGDTHGKQNILQRILDGRAQLWTEPNAALVTSVEVYDTGFKEVRGWLGGGSIDGLKVIDSRVEVWAKTIGAKRMVILGRKGWKRALPDYHELVFMIAKDI